VGTWLGARFWLGAVAGVGLAPLAFTVSLLLGKRAFHRSGVLCKAEVVPVHPAAEALRGPAVVRFSGAGRNEGSTSSDVVGAAIRFLHAEPVIDPDGSATFDGDQDLDVASFDGLLPHRVLQSMKRTDVTDYLRNTYRSVSTCRVCDRWTGEVRAIPGAFADPVTGNTRVERLQNAIATGCARLDLEVHTSRQVIPLATIWLRSVASTRAPKLRTSVLRRERGIAVGGVRSGLRVAVYPAGQLGRALRGG